MTEQELAEYDDCELDLLTGRWAAPMTFSDVRGLCETAPKMSKEEASRFSATVGDCHVDVPADWNRVAAEGLVAAEAKEKARVAAEAKKDEAHALVMAEFKEKARVAAEAKAKAWVEAHAEEQAREKARVEAEAEEQARIADRLDRLETDWVAAEAEDKEWMVEAEKAHVADEEWWVETAESVAHRARYGSGCVTTRRLTEEQWRARKAEASESETP